MKLSLAALAVAGVASAASVPYATAPQAVDVEILQYALTLEHLEAKFYADALGKFSDADFKAAGYPAQVRQRIGEMAVEEATHVTVLSSVLTANGATPTAPCEYSFPYTDIPSFLLVSSILEGVGVSAYLYKAQYIINKQYLIAAGAILTVEARHQAVVSEFQGQDGVPSAFDTPLTGSEVYSLAAAFITSCPASNPGLPFKAFPALEVNDSTPRPGDSLTFTLPAGASAKYVHFYNGLSDTAVELVNGQAAIPSDVTGTVYAVASNSQDRPNDDTTVAGPAILLILNPDATYSSSKKRAIQFTA